MTTHVLTWHIAEAVVHSVNSQKFANVGEIRVELRRCRKMGKSINHVSRKFNGIGEDALPEKAAKGRSISSHTRYVQLMSKGESVIAHIEK